MVLMYFQFSELSFAKWKTVSKDNWYLSSLGLKVDIGRWSEHSRGYFLFISIVLMNKSTSKDKLSYGIEIISIFMQNRLKLYWSLLCFSLGQTRDKLNKEASAPIVQTVGWKWWHIQLLASSPSWILDTSYLKISPF